MTVLPTRNQLAGLNQTQGIVRNALGDFRDMVSEALGNSGTSPLIQNASIQGVTSLGVGAGMTSPGTTMQIAGSVSITTTTTPGFNPGIGSMFLQNRIQFGGNVGVKLDLSETANAQIGVQPNIVYLRTHGGGSFVFYRGGTHNGAAFNSGGGSELLRITDSALTYKGQAVYTEAQHGASLASYANAGTWAAHNEFASTVKMRGERLQLGTSGTVTPILFESNSNGAFIRFNAWGNPSNLMTSIGTQGGARDVVYVRANALALYSGGTHNDTYGNPGTDGTVIFTVDYGSMKYKGSDVVTVSMYGHGNGLNADMVDGLHASSFVTRTSPTRGVIALHRHDSDVNQAVLALWDGSRFYLRGFDLGNQTFFNTRVDFADTASSATNANTADNANNATGNGNIALAMNGDPARKEQIRYLAVNESSVNEFIGANLAESTFPGQIRLNHSTGRFIRVHRADFANNLVAGAVVGFSQLHKATASVRLGSRAMNPPNNELQNTPSADIHASALAAPILFDNDTNRWAIVASTSPVNNTLYYRRWTVLIPGNVSNGGVSFQWDYLTNSGDPELWVVFNPNNGRIEYLSEAEDIINPDGTPPIHGIDPNLEIMKLPFPTLDTIKLIKEGLFRRLKNIPQWAGRSNIGRNPNEIFNNVLNQYIEERQHSMQKAGSLEEFVLDQSDNPKKQQWRELMILRAVSKTVSELPVDSSITLIRENFKVDKRTNSLVLR
jgi:hypothetical protein